MMVIMNPGDDNHIYDDHVLVLIIPGDNMIIVLRHPALVFMMIIMILGDNSW